MPAASHDNIEDNRLIRIFDTEDRKTEDAYFWDWLRDGDNAWQKLKYKWIASSCFGDQVIVTESSPIHDGTAVYLLGPDITGPESDNPNWPDNMVYLGASVHEWLARVNEFGDEHSIAPGDLDQRIDCGDEYRKIYRELNPGLPW